MKPFLLLPTLFKLLFKNEKRIIDDVECAIAQLATFNQKLRSVKDIEDAHSVYKYSKELLHDNDFQRVLMATATSDDYLQGMQIFESGKMINSRGIVSIPSVSKWIVSNGEVIGAMNNFLLSDNKLDLIFTRIFYQ